jgi:SAM-dependent methyltransferase
VTSPGNKLADFWNQRYGKEEFAYGTAPNDFLVEFARHIKPGGRVLCLADGEGRNGVWLAAQGHAVTSVDIAAEGMAKAGRLAAERHVALNTQVADLATHDLGLETWDAIVSIFMHLPTRLRRDLFARTVTALRPGGVVLFEAYAKGQLGRGTGGPPEADLLVALAEVEQEFPGCRILHAFCGLRDVNEGRHHKGAGEVVQLVVQKP